MPRRLIRIIKDQLAALAWRCKGAQIEPGVRFYGSVPSVKLAGPFMVGSRCTFRGPRRSSLEVRQGGQITIGSNTFINGGVEIVSESSVTIGTGCLIGDEVVIQDTSFHEVDEGGIPKVAPIVIGDNVWIARRVIILPGVTVGNHAVIGAGSIVTRNVSAKTVVAGAPAKFIRAVEGSDTFRR